MIVGMITGRTLLEDVVQMSQDSRDAQTTNKTSRGILIYEGNSSLFLFWLTDSLCQSTYLSNSNHSILISQFRYLIVNKNKVQVYDLDYGYTGWIIIGLYNNRATQVWGISDIADNAFICLDDYLQWLERQNQFFVKFGSHYLSIILFICTS